MFTLNQVSLFFSFTSATPWCVRQHFSSKCPQLTAGATTHSTNSLGFSTAAPVSSAHSPTQLQVSPLGVNVMFLLRCLVLVSGTLHSLHQDCVWSSISMPDIRQTPYCPQWEADQCGWHPSGWLLPTSSLLSSCLGDRVALAAASRDLPQDLNPWGGYPEWGERKQRLLEGWN